MFERGYYKDQIHVLILDGLTSYLVSRPRDARQSEWHFLGQATLHHPIATASQQQSD